MQNLSISFVFFLPFLSLFIAGMTCNVSFKFCWGLLNIHDICRGRCRQVLSVEQKWQISCMILSVPYLLGPLVRVVFSTPHHLWSFSPGRLPCLPHPTHQASLSRFTIADSVQLHLHLSFLTPIPPFFGKYLRCTNAQMFWRTWNFLHQATSIRLRLALPTPPCSPSQFVKVDYIFLCFSFPRIFCMSNIHRP